MIYHGVRYHVIGDYAIRELRFILAQDEFELGAVVIEQWLRDLDQKDGSIRTVHEFSKPEPDNRQNLTDAYGKWFDLIVAHLPSISRSDLEQCHELDRKRWPKTKDFDENYLFDTEDELVRPGGQVSRLIQERKKPKEFLGLKGRLLPENVVAGARASLDRHGLDVTNDQMAALITGNDELWGIVHAHYWDTSHSWDTQDRDTLSDAFARSIIGMSHWPTFGEKNSDYDCEFEQKLRDLIKAGVLIDNGFLKHAG